MATPFNKKEYMKEYMKKYREDKRKQGIPLKGGKQYAKEKRQNTVRIIADITRADREVYRLEFRLITILGIDELILDYIADPTYYGHTISYQFSLFSGLLQESTLLQWCECGPKSGDTTHIHGLIKYTKDNTDYDFLYAKYHRGSRRVPIRNKKIRCVHHLINTIHYLSCYRTSVNKDFKVQEHFHRELHGSFPQHSREDCTKAIKSYKEKYDYAHESNCKPCLEFAETCRQRREFSVRRRRNTGAGSSDPNYKAIEKDQELGPAFQWIKDRIR